MRVNVTQGDLLADLTKLCQEVQSRPRFRDLTHEQMCELEKLRESYRAGKINLKLYSVYKVIRGQGYKIPKSTFYDWMQED